jgi:hypothetical protein
VATFRPIPQSVSGVGVRFSIGDRIRDLGEKSFCLTRRERKFFILLRCCNDFSFFILTELGVGRIVGNVVAFLWRGAWGGFGGLAWHPPIALTGWGLVECEIPTLSSHDMMYPPANGAKNLHFLCAIVIPRTQPFWRRSSEKVNTHEYRLLPLHFVVSVPPVHLNTDPA